MLKLFTYLSSYFILARIGHLFNVESSHVALILPSSAIAIIAILDNKKIGILSIFLGAVLSQTFEFETIQGIAGKEGIALLCTATAAIVEALLINYFSWKDKAKMIFFYDDQSYLRFVGSALLGTLIASFIGVLGPFFLGFITGEKLFFTTLTYWLGTFSGIVLFAPLLSVFISTKRTLMKDIPDWGEAFFTLVLLMLTLAFTLEIKSLNTLGIHKVFILLQIITVSIVVMTLYFYFKLSGVSFKHSVDNRWIAILISILFIALTFFLSFYTFELRLSSTNVLERISVISLIILFFGLVLSFVSGVVMFLYESLKLKHNSYRKKMEISSEFFKAKTLYMANMSHEIRTSLNGIVGLIEVMQDSKLPIDQQLNLELIRNSSNSLLVTISDILDYAKIESNEIFLKEKPFSLKSVLTNVEDFHSSTLQDRQVKFVVNIENDVPDDLIGDEARLRQVLVNLVSFSVQHTERGEIILTISKNERHSELGKVSLNFSLKDSGIGIPKNKLRTIFVPFSDLYAPGGRQYTGTGVGLSISKKLVSLMDSDLEVESKLGEGTHFFFDLELEEGEHNTYNTQEVSAKYNNEFSSNFPGSILIVEDNSINLKVMVTFLNLLGYRPETARNGKEAIEACRFKKFDLVFMDLQMPIMDGYVATRRILSDPSINYRPKIIALTAHVYEEDRKKCFETGMVDFLAKPINKKVILNILERHLSYKDSNKEQS